MGANSGISAVKIVIPIIINRNISISIASRREC